MTKTRKQVKRILNCLLSSQTERDWPMAAARHADMLAAPAALPTTKDLRAKWWAINNQNSTGSCVGWATADSVIRWHMVKARRLAKDQLLSPRFVWMASKETDQWRTPPTTFIEAAGTSLKAALDVARKYGSVRDSVLPFDSGKLYPGDELAFYALAAQRKIASYFNLGQNLDDWRFWLATQGPILTRLGVEQTWDNASATQGKLDIYRPDTVRGGHAVALVGYTRERFIVRNSWGTAWGDKGYAYASEGYAAAAFTEAYGVTVV